MSKKIPLSRGFKSSVDDEDFLLFSYYNWYASTTSDGHTYAKRVCKNDVKRSSVYLHHCIIGKPPKGFCVDHINGNTLDNRKINLRIVSVSENNFNQKVTRDNKYSSIRGVHLHCQPGRKKRWMSVVHKNGHRETNYFCTREEAETDVLLRKKLLGNKRTQDAKL